MPRPPKDPADKRDQGVTVLFTKAEKARLEQHAERLGVRVGQLVRDLVNKGLSS